MSYLTQILVPYETAIRHLKIRDSYDWHQRVWHAFKGRDGEKRDFLSRVDEVDEAYRLLIVSPMEPNKPDWCPTDCFKTKPIPDDFLAARDFRFSILVNPTRKVRGDAAGNRTKNGRRLPLTKREDLVAWMQRKAEAGGFDIGDVDHLRTIPKPRNYFQKEGMSGVHFAVEFQGVLTVTDAELFRRTFATGIGSAKAFGFGLLALTPLS
jgi:CRISPR system Cascade subunit CasE